MVKSAIKITIILNSVILIGVPAGHGYGLMAMFEFLSIPYLIRNGIEFGKDNPFEGGLILAALISLIGKVFLIVSLFYKKIRDKKILIDAGLFLVLISFMSISYKAWQYDNFLLIITFGSGIPFLMYLGRVIYLLHRQERTAENESDEKKPAYNKAYEQ